MAVFTIVLAAANKLSVPRVDLMLILLRIILTIVPVVWVKRSRIVAVPSDTTK